MAEKNTNVLVFQMADISTKYIPKKTAEALGMSEAQVRGSVLYDVIAHSAWADYGWIIGVSGDARDAVRDEHLELANLIDWCIEQGLDYLKLDCDAGDGPDGFPVFDWESDDKPYEHLNVSIEATPAFEPEVKCPRCGSSDQVRQVDDWSATSKQDLLNVAQIKEYQCHCKTCAGASFWI